MADPTNDPTFDPTDPLVYLALGQTPPWIKEGFTDFASWSQAVGQDRALSRAHDEATIALQNKQLNATSAGTGAQIRGQDLSAQQNAAALAEQQRQYDLTLGYNKARGDQSMQLDQAKQAWQQAVDARDFGAAEHWKQVASDLAERQFKASISGPQDWIKYWRDSRGAGAPATPGTQAPGTQVPAWAGSTPAAPVAAAAVPKWTQAAPGWQQPNGTVTSPTVADLAAHGPTTATTFTGQNGTPIDFSGSEWMKKQVAAIPTWAK